MRELINNEPLRVGLIGAGRIVERAHLPLLNKMPEVIVAGIFDPDFGRAQAMADCFGVPAVCSSPDELFGLDLDVTLVACPNSLHAAMTIRALEAGTHVLCEKPMAINVAQAKAMIETAEAMNLELMVASTNRYRPEVIALQKAIQENQLGEIKAIRCGWLRSNGIPGANTWFTNRLLAGGGVLTDLGSHLIDLVISIIGRRKLLSVRCVFDRTMDKQTQASWYLPISSQQEAKCDVEVGASGFVIFEGPLDVFIEVSWASGVPQDRTYLQVIGTRGVAQMETLFGFSPNGHRPRHPLQIWRDGLLVSQDVEGTIDLLDPYQNQWKFFVDSLRNGKHLSSLMYDGLAMVNLIEAMYESADELELTNALTKTC